MTRRVDGTPRIHVDVDRCAHSAYGDGVQTELFSPASEAANATVGSLSKPSMSKSAEAVVTCIRDTSCF